MSKYKDPRDYYNALYFDSSRPTVTEIKSRVDGNFIDLRKEKPLTTEMVLETFLTARGCGVIVPNTYSFWDRDSTWKIRDEEIKLDTPIKFNKYGPEVNLNTSSMSIKLANETEFLPISAMKEKARGMGIEIGYRGFGYFDIRSKQHRLIPFNAIPLGWKFLEAYGREIEVHYQHGDIFCTTLSASREDKSYTFSLRPTATKEKYVLWTQTYGDDGCEDSNFREIRSKRKVNIGEYEHDFKYSRGEIVWCKHKIAAYNLAVKISHMFGKTPILVDMFPMPTGIMNPWYLMKNYTIIVNEDGSRARRPLNTEINTMLGRLMAYKTEQMFAW
jgi:hypothetical protein